ncbi:MAG: DUF2225 domain-containing protein [Treponema sp.]|jgi:uncharacterized protein (DUF2225 family)|nr:DUF2225 domain-containing protein [Treponema sp.]
MAHGVKKVGSPKKPAVSYWSKDTCRCPVCKKEFQREEMLSGNGRMIAGPLTDELHRIYEPSARFGKVYPLIYAVGACPNCHTALLWNDFEELSDNDSIDRISVSRQDRMKKVNTVFPYYSLTRERTLLDSAAMYYLAILTYEKSNLELLPTIKRAILSLRLAWLCLDLDEACPGHNYKYVSDVFYRKAVFFYQQAVINETARVERSSNMNNFGPDIDKNYGWDGVVYLCALLEYKYGQREDHELRLKKLEEMKTSIARIFGFGKSTKAKPGPLLEHSRTLYDNLSAEIEDGRNFAPGGVV